MPLPLCTTFRKQASFVWNHMQKASRLGFSLSEETITELSLYEIAVKHQHSNISIEIATKPQEYKHGADWEWWIIKGNKTIPFRIQAKRLFRGGHYQSLFHSKKNPYCQLDKLVLRARTEGFVPLYCFYNFQDASTHFSGPNICKHKYRAPSYWGCSLASPHQVKAAGTDVAASLCAIMYPWHVLVCEKGIPDLLQAAKNFIQRATGNAIAPQNLPPRIQRLIALREERVKFENLPYLDFAYGSENIPNDVNGVALIRDVR